MNNIWGWIVVWYGMGMFAGRSIFECIEYISKHKVFRVRDLWLLLFLPTTLVGIIIFIIAKNFKFVKLDFSKIKSFLNKRII
jgi:hypothetical protein